MSNTTKKILFLGGFEKMIDAVNAAHEMGLYVIVTDYLENSPAKKIADEALSYSIDDVENIVKYCLEHKVDSVLNIFVDPAQKPYQEICTRLNLPCYGTKKQFEYLTDKKLFKKLCHESEVQTIPEYLIDLSDNDWKKADIAYPIYIKPVDKYASKGQSVCNDSDAVEAAIQKARELSGSHTFIAEKFMTDNDFTIKYRFDNEHIEVLWTADRYLHNSSNGTGRIAIAHGMPSKFTQLYFEKVHANICNMFHKLNITAGEAFLQGFVDGETIRFYDPAFRFSGGQTYRIIDEVFNMSQLKEIICFAITGAMNNEYSCASRNKYLLKGKRAVILMPTMNAGIIKEIRGLDEISDHSAVVALTQTHYIGDNIVEDGTAQQRIAYIHVVSDTKKELIETVRWINHKLSVIDIYGNEMLTRDFNPELLNY